MRQVTLAKRVAANRPVAIDPKPDPRLILGGYPKATCSLRAWYLEHVTRIPRTTHCLRQAAKLRYPRAPAQIANWLLASRGPYRPRHVLGLPRRPPGALKSVCVVEAPLAGQLLLRARLRAAGSSKPRSRASSSNRAR